MNIKYRQSSEEIAKAWFEYVKANPNLLTKPSVLSFVAGYNAAMANLKNTANKALVSEYLDDYSVQQEMYKQEVDP